MEVRNDQAAKDKVFELIKDARIAMMATRGEYGTMHARPMGTNHTEFHGELWFLTDVRSEKVHDLERDDEVLLAYSDTAKQNYVSISGRGEVLRDRAILKDLWFEAARTWFPKGVDDPDLAAIKVTVEMAEYWDSPSSAMVYIYGYAKALTTGRRPNPGENATVRFS
ncbi:pyridoxamine 5'-phosphate oxidase family protein [Prosthecomicrobium sp. N25]|uniref:pyridoxamine 5'-phosphate oxidase family protein n=1 Tax=Prosthecomicrobium sp. N25 TaxID=3129254 RepID=UPI0030775384